MTINTDNFIKETAKTDGSYAPRTSLGSWDRKSDIGKMILEAFGPQSKHKWNRTIWVKFHLAEDLKLANEIKPATQLK